MWDSSFSALACSSLRVRRKLVRRPPLVCCEPGRCRPCQPQSTDVELLPADLVQWDAEVAEAVLEDLHHRRWSAHVDPHVAIVQVVQNLGRGEESLLLGDYDMQAKGRMRRRCG